MMFTRRSFIGTLTLSLVPFFFASADDPLASLKPFLKKNCFACHGPEKQKNDIRFDTLGTDLSDVTTLKIWQEALDQLNLGEMPPKKKPRPDAAELAKVVDTLTSSLKLAYAKQRSTGAQTVARRLNRFELRNTIRDLLYINDPELRIGNTAGLVDNNGNGRVENTSSDPFRSFPADEIEEGFDNIGDRLVMSDFFLTLMLGAAEESIALATDAGPRPKIETRRIAGLINKRGSGDLERFSRELNKEFDTFFQKGTLRADVLGSGVRVSARYRVTYEISGHNQKHPWGEVLPTNQEEPFLLSVHLAKGRTQIPLANWELPGDGKKRTFTFESWIDKSWYPNLSWDNGPTNREARADFLVKKYLPDLFQKQPDKKVIPKQDHKKVFEKWKRDLTIAALENYKGPTVRVHSLTLEPLIDQWPPKSHLALYGRGPVEKADVAALLLAFAQRAFRRTVKAKEIEPYVELVKASLPGKNTRPSGGVQDLIFKAYKGKWSNLPDFSKLTPLYEGSLANGLIDIRPSQMRDYFGMVFEGKLTAPQDGKYEFQMASDDGARIIVGGKKVLEHDGLHGASLRKATTELKAGTHDIRVEYCAYGLPNSFRASWRGPSFGDTPLSVDNSSKKQLIASSPEAAQTIKALQVGYTAMLCSPDFLYLQEKPGRLNNFAIASRLSYFLWSSMPDDELFALAKAGKLTEPAVLEQQVVRMLVDPESEGFTHHFTQSWLRLDKLRENPPERNGPFRIYWDRRMEPQIVRQTNTFFADVLKSNGPIRTLIDSDYTFLNEQIALVFYGRKDVKGDFLRKVSLNDPRRGGIFTQPSVMTATANGVDTSPVVRGVWVLESVLGTPPAPPPPDVKPLSPDLRKANTIREQLDIHRKQPACNSCHRKIDPMGFPFENFDPIGRWRDKYPKARNNIDAATTMSTGEEIKDIVDFKKMLLTREKDIARSLAEKLLTYSSGRILEPTDRGEIDSIVEKLEKQDYRLRDLIKLVVQSEVFLTK
jgi:hypothetical protein